MTTPKTLKLDFYNVVTPLEDRTTFAFEPMAITAKFDGTKPEALYPKRHRVEGTAEMILFQYLAGVTVALAAGEVYDESEEFTEETLDKIMERAEELKTSLIHLLTSPSNE